MRANWEFCVCLCFVMHYFVSILVLQYHLEEEWKAGCFAIIGLQMYCYYESSRCRGLVCSMGLFVFPDF